MTSLKVTPCGPPLRPRASELPSSDGLATSVADEKAGAGGDGLQEMFLAWLWHRRASHAAASFCSPWTELGGAPCARTVRLAPMRGAKAPAAIAAPSDSARRRLIRRLFSLMRPPRSEAAE